MLLTSISEWLVKGLIECCFYDNYQSVGTGTEEEIQSVYANLISQYHQAVKNEQVGNYIKLVKEIKLIELRWAILANVAEIMTERYCESGAIALRTYYPAYQFTPESFKDDLDMVSKSEIANQIKYERLQAQLAKLDGSQKTESALTPVQRHANFLSRLAEINKYEGTRYKVDETTVLELAVLENRLNDYIETLQEQAQKNGSVN